MATDTLPVLIVGAGPTGLMMACELARYGISVRIIDKKSAPTSTSNAAGIQARTLEIFSAIGVIDPFLQAGVKADVMHFHYRGKQIVEISFKQLSSDYPFILMLPQAKTEAILIDRLHALNVNVEWQTELVRFTDKNNHIEALIRSDAKNEETLLSAWIIGCDGARSIVRQQASIAFPGEDIEEQFIVADATMQTTTSQNEINVFTDTGTVFAAFPLGKSLYRFVVNLHQQTPQKTLPEATVQQLVLDRSDTQFQAKSVNWLSPFWIHSKMSACMKKGRVILAGDAAHIHSPVGAQGMNTGLQDAYNLAWKLALVLKGNADEKLLESYQAERIPVIKKVVSISERMTRFMLSSNKLIIMLRNTMLRIMNTQTWLKNKITMTIAELNITYINSPIVNTNNKVPSGAPKPGARAPIQYFLNNARHTVLLFCDNAQSQEMQQTVRMTKDAIIERMGDLCDVRIIANNTVDELAMYDAYCIKQPSVYIIRPDYYIGYYAGSIDLKAILESACFQHLKRH